MKKNGIGWQCPGCGVNYAPSVDRCECTKHAPVQRYVYPYPYWPYWGYQRWYVGDPPYWGTITADSTNIGGATTDFPIGSIGSTAVLSLNTGGSA